MIQLFGQSFMSQEAERGMRASAHEFRGRMSQIIHDRVLGDVRKAAALERIICRQSLVSSLSQRNADPSVAVDEGLKQIMVALMNRRQRRECQSREEALQGVLGYRFKVVMTLVRQICMARLGQASLGCSNGLCSRNVKRNGSTIGKPVLPRLACRMPSPVLRLFFRNQLCRAVEQCPISKLAEQDWDAMIEDAKRDLKDYCEWSSQAANQGHNFAHPPAEKRLRDDIEDQDVSVPDSITSDETHTPKKLRFSVE